MKTQGSCRFRPTRLLLVYARVGHDQDEPRISCVTGLDELSAVEAKIAVRRLALDIRWESVPWQHSTSDGFACGEVVYLVSVGSPRNLIGLQAFDTREAAESFAANRSEETMIEVCPLNAVDQQALEALRRRGV